MPEPQERIVVHGFAGITHVELDIYPVTVLIGPQSVGKSVTAKLVYFFQRIPYVLQVSAFSDKSPTWSVVLLAAFTKLFPETTNFGKAYSIRYTSPRGMEILVEFAPDDTEPLMTISEPLRQAYLDLSNAVKLQQDNKAEDLPGGLGLFSNVLQANHDYWEKVYASLSPRSVALQRFIPSGRSFYAQLERDFMAFFASQPSLDPTVVDFGILLANLKQTRDLAESSDAQLVREAHRLVGKLLGGVYRQEGREDFIEFQDGRKLHKRIWSSGQQEAHPMALFLQRCCEKRSVPGSVFIEEPEAHLFPDAQRTITELMMLTYNARKTEMQLFITTHSPYILTTINNLILAGQVYESKPSREKLAELEKVVPEMCAITPGTVQVYFMDRAGCRSIMDDETGLIGTSAIDEASSDISDQFSALLDIAEK